MPSEPMRYSRIVSSCALVRFLMIEIARRTRPGGLEIAQQDDRVGEIGDVDRGLHVADQPVLGDGQEGRRALAVEELQQLVHVQDQLLLLGHRLLVAVEAVDHDGARAEAFDARPHPLREFAGAHLGGVDLLDQQIAAVLQRLEVDAEALGAFEQQARVPRRR